MSLARSIGSARVQMTALVGNESDAFEDVIAVEILASPETVAAYGEARPDAGIFGQPGRNHARS